MLNIKETASIVTSATTENAKLAATITAGNVLNRRISKIVSPKLPLMVRGYAQTPIGEAVVANMVAAALIHVMPNSSKVLMAADAIQKASMLELAGSFNIEDMVDELLSGVSIPGMTETKEA